MAIVLTRQVEARDNQKRYRFTPPVSIWRMADALSVDALCGFGAKKITGCTEITQFGPMVGLNASRVAGHFRVFESTLGPVMVQGVDKCHMSGRRKNGRRRLARREAGCNRRYAACLSLGAPSIVEER